MSEQGHSCYLKQFQLQGIELPTRFRKFEETFINESHVVLIILTYMELSMSSGIF